MPDRPERGLLNTSAVIDLDELDPAALPRQITVSAVTMAELAAGPAAASDAAERARRQDRLQRAEAVVDPIPFDAEAARAYGRICAAVFATGRKPGRRFADLQIAATALAANLPLVTRNRDDLYGLEQLLDIIEV